MRRAARTDDNHSEIVKARRLPCYVVCDQAEGSMSCLRALPPPIDPGEDYSDDEEQVPAAPCATCGAGEGAPCASTCKEPKAMSRCDACGAGAPGKDFLCGPCMRLLPKEHIEGLNTAALSRDRDRLALAQEIAAARLKQRAGLCVEPGCLSRQRAGHSTCLRHSGSGEGGAAAYFGGTALAGELGEGADG